MAAKSNDIAKDKIVEEKNSTELNWQKNCQNMNMMMYTRTERDSSMLRQQQRHGARQNDL